MVRHLFTPTTRALDSFDIVALKIALNHENRLRTLEGKSAVTLAQFKAEATAL